MANELQQLIIERIQREGPIPFAEYMRMALYEPGYGYYVTEPTKIGWEEGDYYTSTDLSSFFANCMGRQLQQMWQNLGQPTNFVVLEQGAGRGHLAQGVCAWAEQEAPAFSAALDYQTEDILAGQNSLMLAVPPHPEDQGVLADENQGVLADADQGVLADANQGVLADENQGVLADENQGVLADENQGGGKLTPLLTAQQAIPRSIGDLRTPTDAGDMVGPPCIPPTTLAPTEPLVVLANELVDAFPVHIVEAREKRLYEVFVSVEKGRLYEVLGEPSSVEVASYLDKYKVPWQRFADGWRAEINLDALRWIESVARRMQQGFLLTIDYGDRAKALYTGQRRRGTLVCYTHHRMNEHPLIHPGAQDITAHVNFSALIDEGRRHGFRLSALTTQRLWLEGLGIYEDLQRRRLNDFAEADTARASDRGQVALLRWYNLRQQVLALTDTAGMGNFKVLILRRAGRN